MDLKHLLGVCVGAAVLMGTSGASATYTYESANSNLLNGFRPSNWGDDYAAGMYEFNTVSGGMLRLLPGGTVFSDLNHAAYANGRYYVLKSDYNWLTGYVYSLAVYDADTWELISSNQLDFGPCYGGCFTVSSDGKTVYTMRNEPGSSGFSEPVLVAVDTETLEVKRIATTEQENNPLPAWIYYNAMCVGADGNLLMFGDQYIYSADVTTGDVKNLGNGKYSPINAGVTRDPQSGLIYMICQGDDQLPHVITFDVDTYEQTDLGNIPGNSNIRNIYFTHVNAAAPSALEDIKFSYASVGSNSATLSFQLPVKTYGGETLSSTVEAVISVDGNEQTVSGNPGETKTIDQILETGNHTIKLIARNDNGVSPARLFSTYTGVDVPAAVENLTFDIDGEGEVTLSWSEPTKSVNGGEFDRDNLNYTVVRYPFGVEVASHIKATEFKESLGDAYGKYSYKVTVFAGDNEGASIETQTITSGTVDVPPFIEDLQNDWYAMDRFTTYDPFDNGWGWANGGNCYVYEKFDADYSLFTPAIRMKAGETYTLRVDTRTSASDMTTALLEIGLTSSPSTSGTLEYIAENLVVTPACNAYYFDFKVPNDGNYFLAFRNITPRGGSSLAINAITVTVNSESTAPAAPAGLTCEAAEAGALSAVIKGNAPTANADGSALSNIDKIVLTNPKDGKVLTELTGVAPGASFEFKDTEAVAGMNCYAVYAVAGDKKGMAAHTASFVGKDTPSAIGNVKAEVSGNNVTLSWTAPATGVNGGYIDPQDVTYTITRCDELDGYYYPEIASDLDKCEFTDEVTVPAGLQQNVYTYRIVAHTAEGKSAKTQLRVTAGEAYAMPFIESAAAGKYENNAWFTTEDYGTAEWTIADGTVTAIQPYDADGGMLDFGNSGFLNSFATLSSPMVELKNLHNPSLVMYVNHGFETDKGDLTLDVRAVKANGEKVVLGSVDYNDGTSGWGRHSFSLDGYENGTVLRFELSASACDGSARLMVDKLSVANSFDNDMELSNLNIPAVIDINSGAAIVDVANVGKNPASFTVTLYKDGKAVSSVSVDDLEADTARKLEMDMGLSIFDAGKNVEFYAAVEMAGDENSENDVCGTIEVFVKGNTLPTVEIEGEVEDNDVTLSWTKPANEMIVATTDDFTSYSPYALDNFGGWRTYDGDGKATEFSKFWTTIPNAKAPMAWEVWNVDQVEADGFFDFGASREGYDSHSGNACLISFTAVENGFFGEYASANDNWLISPKVIGGTDITFYMRTVATYNPHETIELLYTTEDIDENDIDVDAFELLASYDLVTSDWRLFSEILPLDAVRFAIRQTTQSGASTLLLDDITYTPAVGSTKEIVSKGYNVYRNGELVANVREESFSELVKDKGQYEYYVTTLWEEGESCISNVFYAEIENNASSGVEDYAAGISVTTENGMICINAEAGAECMISDLSGRVYFSQIISGPRKIAVNYGIYVVNINGNTYKVVVK